MTAVHLFVPMLHRHDAVGEHTQSLHRRLVATGVPSTIYTEVPDPDTADLTRPYLEYVTDSRPGDVLVYQFATASGMAGWLARRPEPVVVNYHSITPPEYFRPWNNRITRLQVAAQIELSELAPRAALGIAVSRFDEAELQAAGCPRTVVVPVANVAVPPVAPEPSALVRLSEHPPGPGHRWLSVGRLAPNKGHHRTIAALFVARTLHDPLARLTVVGAPTEPAYAAALARYAAALGLDGDVVFVSGIGEAELAAHYRCADALVMLSDHEGFGVPLVEAMGQGLPVVALDAGAVGEVLGGAGTLLDDTAPRHVAGVVSDLLGDPGRCTRLAARGRARFSALGLDHAADLLIEAVLAVRGPAPAGG